MSQPKAASQYQQGRRSLNAISPSRRGTLAKLNVQATKMQVFLRCKGGQPPAFPSSTSAYNNLKLVDNNAKTSSIIDLDIAKDDPTNEFLHDVVLLPATTKIFHFDRVFVPRDAQEDVFEDVAKPLLNDVFKGASCTIFAYGQTGTGKTFTMEGDLKRSGENAITEAAGLIPRSLCGIFEKLNHCHSDSYVTVSMLELYKEELRDLLSVADPKQLVIYDGKDDDRAYVHNLREVKVDNIAEGLEALKTGVNRRMTAATNINDKSSRSHCIFTINVYIKNEAGQKVVQVGKLNMVDLAGSENNKLAGADLCRAKEAASINKSLLTLGRVITSLVDKTSHIPYRESKLTRLLKDSLGGQTKTCIIATVAPYSQSSEDVKSTLEYANMANNIVNYTPRTVEIAEERTVEELWKRIRTLEEDLQVSYEKSGVHLPRRRYEQLNSKLKDLEEKESKMQQTIEGLLQKVQVLEKAAQQDARTKIQEQEKNQELERARQQKIHELERKLQVKEKELERAMQHHEQTLDLIIHTAEQARGTKRLRDETNITDTRIAEQARGTKRLKEEKTSKDARIAEEAREAKESKDEKDVKDARIPEEARETKESKDENNVKDTRIAEQARGTEGPKNEKNFKDTRIAEQARGTEGFKDQKSVKDTRSAEQARMTKAFREQKNIKDTRIAEQALEPKGLRAQKSFKDTRIAEQARGTKRQRNDKDVTDTRIAKRR